ncbi:phage minor capsid protein [Lacticaseibacillus saniviri]|uniref:phage minor capsid protein n=1 Tax=Lacticaseibacillus saniviri TaxID=931533 RepID=UPI001EDE5D1E|nr:phage minor capsid protein [Lacticaseibacillus saniviri]MCG4280849.1 capsid protein [Lacticaseibacillus saniviri]
MPRVTQHQLEFAQSILGDVYGHLEQRIYELFVDRLKAKGTFDIHDNVLGWQLEKLNELHLLNEDVIAEVSKATGIAKTQLTQLITGVGYQIADDTYSNLASSTGQQIAPPNQINQILEGYLNQTFLDLDNNVNQTLITTNYGDNSATQTYQDIIRNITSEVVIGAKTPDRAIADTIYKWRDQGIKSSFVDKGGHNWSVDSYARTVITTTSNHAFQAVRDQAADDYGIDVFVMSSHAASRPACAPIQGHLVTTRDEEFDTPDGEHVYALSNYGYGEPGGTFGINCHHNKWPFVIGVNTNNQPQFDPEEAEANGEVQQQQRALERRVRGYKQQKALAEKLDDGKGQAKYSQLIRSNQAALRQLVKDNEFLHRDYSREKSYNVGVDEKAQKVRSTINQQQYEKHRVGTKAFENYVKGSKGPVSEMTLNKDEQQALINQYGTSDFAVKQVFFEHSSPIGYYVDESGNRIPTDYGRISYSKSGAHITPRRPR